MRYLFLIVLLFSCSSQNELKNIKKELDTSESELQPLHEPLPESLKAKFEILNSTIPQPTIIKPQNRKDSTKSSSKLSKTSFKKENSNIIPSDYPEALKMINDKAKKVWELYTPNHSKGEEIYLQIKYLGINVGKLKLVNHGLKVIDGKEVWHFQARFKTASFYSSIYELNDSIETFVDAKKFLSVRYSLIQRESNFDIDDIQLFDRNSLKTFWFYNQMKKKNGEKKKKEKISFIPYYSSDPFSVIFFMQGLPLNKGDIYEIPLINKSEVEIMKVNVIGAEEIFIQGDPVQAIKLSARMSGKKSGDITFWLSNNQQRSLLKVNAKISIGSVNAEVVRE